MSITPKMASPLERKGEQVTAAQVNEGRELRNKEIVMSIDVVENVVNECIGSILERHYRPDPRIVRSRA